MSTFFHLKDKRQITVMLLLRKKEEIRESILSLIAHEIKVFRSFRLRQGQFYVCCCFFYALVVLNWVRDNDNMEEWYWKEYFSNLLGNSLLSKSLNHKLHFPQGLRSSYWNIYSILESGGNNWPQFSTYTVCMPS